MFACRLCGSLIAKTPARIRTYNWTCFKCSNQHRDQDIARYLTRKLSETRRYKGFKAPHPGVDFVRNVIKKCEGKSIISGCSDLKKLCVVLIGSEGVLMTITESHDFAKRKKD